MRKLVLILCAIALSVAAATATAQSTPQTLIPENEGWHFHVGDSSAFPSTNFDDSAWQVVDIRKFDAAMVQQCTKSICWLRKDITLSPGKSPLQLLLFGARGSLEVYADGRRISPPFQPPLLWTSNQEMVYLLPSSSNNVEVAIKLDSRQSDINTYFDQISVAIGDEPSVRAAATAHQGVRIGAQIFPIFVNVVVLLAGFLFISLYWQQRGHSEYLWLGLSLIFLAGSAGGVAVWVGGVLPIVANAFIGDPVSYFLTAVELEFVYAFIGRKPGRTIRVYQILMLVAPLVLNPLAWTGHIGGQAQLVFEAAVNLPGVVWIVVMLLLWRRRGSREAGLLLIPMLLANAAGLVIDTEYIIRVYKPGFHIHALHLGLIEITYWPLTELLFLFSVGLVIFLRFNNVTRDQAIAHAELESARSIQQVLIPEALPDIPNLRIESVYHPAQQVGGDFFQIIPLPEGTLIAIGDVSGKGLPAAMNVALIVGTLRTLAEQTSSPAAILAGLNRRLLGRGPGFTTCLVLHILSNGRATLANAGHLSPYLAGAELELPNGLPLGLTTDSIYEETTITLDPSQTLTLITDGVVEATNPTTHELFGFDRTRAISHLPAHEIANTAQTFGQEDDIAVLTLQYHPA